MIQISVDTLKVVIDKFINKMRQKNELYIYFKEDLYWTVPEENLTNMSEKPELLVGSLADDVDFLNRIVGEDFDVNYLELERLSSVFKHLSLQLTI